MDLARRGGHHAFGSTLLQEPRAIRIDATVLDVPSVAAWVRRLNFWRCFGQSTKQGGVHVSSQGHALVGIRGMEHPCSRFDSKSDQQIYIYYYIYIMYIYILCKCIYSCI